MATPVKSSKKRKRVVTDGVAHIKATFNNTIITLTDTNGNKIADGQNSAGASGFRGSRKSTPFAALEAGTNLARIAKDNGLRSVDAIIKGPGPGRDSAVRGLAAGGLKVNNITDITAVPHNGCRPKKKRRV